MIIRLSVPTWLYVIQQHNNLTKFDCLDHFPHFLLHCSIHVLPSMVGLTINPVFRLISQQPGPIKMCQATRHPWSYICNYNQINYQCSYTSPIPQSECNLLITHYYVHEILRLCCVTFAGYSPLMII